MLQMQLNGSSSSSRSSSSIRRKLRAAVAELDNLRFSQSKVLSVSQSYERLIHRTDPVNQTPVEFSKYMKCQNELQRLNNLIQLKHTEIGTLENQLKNSN
jgi:hypothetical protein